MPTPLHVAFIAGAVGPWRVERVHAVTGETLPPAERLSVLDNSTPLLGNHGIWTLRGVTSNTRYAAAGEVKQLSERQQGLSRPEATCAALIPIRKNEAWWNMAQDQRRHILEEQSRHFTIGLDYLPAIARRLHHSRELAEPFDFLTWFEYSPEHSEQFEELVRRLRGTPEWSYVDREIDIRLTRAE